MPALPREALLERLRKEIQQARGPGPFRVKLESAPDALPARLSVTLFEAPAPVPGEGGVADGFVHRLEMRVTEEYPYAKPIVSWQTPIFHPNVQPPAEGGRFCSRLLTGLDQNSTLVDHIRAIAALLARPDPANAFSSPTARAAAERFRSAPYVAPPMR